MAREIFYKFNTLGAYETTDNTDFGSDSHLKLILESHDFSIAVGGETLRKSSCAGYSVLVSSKGGAVFYDSENNEICNIDECDKLFVKVSLKWSQDLITIQFGQFCTIDNYPNCDGESDRWTTEWVVEREIKFNTLTNHAEIL